MKHWDRRRGGAEGVCVGREGGEVQETKGGGGLVRQQARERKIEIQRALGRGRGGREGGEMDARQRRKGVCWPDRRMMFEGSLGSRTRVGVRRGALQAS